MIVCEGKHVRRLLSLGVLIGNYRISVDDCETKYVHQSRVMYVECIEENWEFVTAWVDSFCPMHEDVVVNFEEVLTKVTENMLYEAGIQRMRFTKIPMIKIIKYTTGLGLVDSKNIADDFQEAFDIETIENMDDFWKFIKFIEDARRYF